MLYAKRRVATLMTRRHTACYRMPRLSARAAREHDACRRAAKRAARVMSTHVRCAHMPRYAPASCYARHYFRAARTRATSALQEMPLY